jgi:membrane protease YdiL (CAAX protease family)
MRPDLPTLPRRVAIAKVSTFLALTVAFAAAPYAMMARAGSTRDYALAWMWSPCAAALATRLIFHRCIRGLGWKAPRPIWILAGLAIPLGYSLFIYSTVWIGRLGTFQPSTPTRLLLFATFGLLAACFAALGEEIGWRGLLIPELIRLVYSSKAPAMTGLVWAAWHMPAVLFADYHNEGPRWLDVFSLTIAVIGLSFFTARLRLALASTGHV